MFTHKGQQFKSKAAIVRYMLDNGEMTTSPNDKNRVAKYLGMTVQTVHATIMKHLTNKRVAKMHPKPVKRSFPKVKKNHPVVSSGNYFETRQQVRDAFAECYKTASKKGYNLDEIEIRFDLKGTCGGQFCWKYGKMYFRVNLQLAHENIDDYLKQTVPHEFCHYIQRMEDKNVFYRSQPHGYEWKSLMLDVFNLDPKRCHNYDTSNVKQRRGTKYIYKCNCMEHPLGAIRHRNFERGKRLYRCRRCGKQLTWTGKVV